MNKMDLFVKFTPIVYLHSGESYYPVEIKNYIKNSRLVKEENEDVVMENITDKNINELSKYDKKYYLELKTKEAREGDKGKQNYFYCFVNSGYDDFNGEFTDLTYVLCFSYNGTLSAHDFDTESITIRIDSEEKIKKIILSSHGKYFSYNPNEIEYEGNRPIIYSAYESHAFYPDPKTYRRMFNFGNDCCERGVRLDDIQMIKLPEDPNLLPDNYEYLKFNGKRAKNFNERFPPLDRYKLNTTNFACPQHTLQKISGIYYDIYLYLFIALAILVLINIRFRYNIISILIGAILTLHMVFGLNNI